MGFERFEVPGGWIYLVGLVSHPVYVPHPPAGPAIDTASILEAVHHLKLEITRTMSDLKQQLDTGIANLKGDFAILKDSVTSLEARYTAALAGVTSGNITQAQVDELNAIGGDIQALAASVPAAPVGTAA